MNERFTEPEFSPPAIYRLVGVTLVIEIANRRENLSGVVPYFCVVFGSLHLGQ